MNTFSEYLNFEYLIIFCWSFQPVAYGTETRLVGRRTRVLVEDSRKFLQMC